MPNRLTYAQLFRKLKKLCYSKKQIQWNGARQNVFQHPKFESATIFIPDMPLDQPVEPIHIGAVRATLKAHDLVDETSWGVF